MFAFGPEGASSAVADGPVEIVFKAVYFKRARKPEPIEVGEFAKLGGVLEFESDTRPVIRYSDAQGPSIEELREIEGEDHPEAGPLPPLSLHLQFGAGFVRDAPSIKASEPSNDEEPTPETNAESEGDADSVTAVDGTKTLTRTKPATQSDDGMVPENRKLRLRIPGPPEPCAYLEIHAALTRDGAPLAGASAEVNGRLDINLNALDFLVIKFSTHDGEILADAPVRVTLADSTVTESKTDADGRLALNGVPPGSCELFFPNHAGVVVEEESVA